MMSASGVTCTGGMTGRRGRSQVQQGHGEAQQRAQHAYWAREVPEIHGDTRWSVQYHSTCGPPLDTGMSSNQGSCGIL